MFRKNDKKANTLLTEIQVVENALEVTSNDYVNDLFLDLNRSNFLFQSLQYIDNLMIYYGYIEQYISNGQKNRDLHRKSLSLNLIDRS